MDRQSPTTNIDVDVADAVRILCEHGWQLKRSSPTLLLFERFAYPNLEDNPFVKESREAYIDKEHAEEEDDDSTCG
jgi:hypothetical protein